VDGRAGGTYQQILQAWVVIKPDRDHSNVSKSAHGSANDIIALQPHLSVAVKAAVVHLVVVSFGQNADLSIFVFMHFQNAVHDWDVTVFDVEDYDFSCLHKQTGRGTHRQTQKVKSGAHAQLEPQIDVLEADHRVGC